MNVLRILLDGVTGGSRCGDAREHPPHRHCPGLVDVPCELTRWHGPHWTGPARLCRGRGLGAICVHGEQILNECDEC